MTDFLSLQSKHEVKNKEQLLVLIRRFPEGMPVIDLKDAYPNVMEDLQVSEFSPYPAVRLSSGAFIIIFFNWFILNNAKLQSIRQ